MVSILYFFTTEKYTSFVLYDDERCFLSKDAEEFLIYNARCANCDTKINEKFKPCQCKKNLAEDDLIGDYYLQDDFYDKKIEILKTFWKKAKRKMYDRENSKIRRDSLKEIEGFHTKQDIKKLWEAQNGKCYFCGVDLKQLTDEKPFEVEHLTPVSEGGTNWIQNISLTCANCNRSKHKKTSTQFWKALKERFGADWVNERQTYNRSCLSKKRKITNYKPKK